MKTLTERIKGQTEHYEHACKYIAIVFRDKYFDKDAEIDFVCDDVTGTAMINDYFFNINEMYEYLTYRYTATQMFQRYDEQLENAMLKKPLPFTNIKNWKKELKNK